MGGKWPYSGCFAGCYPHDVFNIALSILVTSFFSIRLVNVYVVHPYSSIDTTAAWKKLSFFIGQVMTDSLSIVVHAFASRVLMSVSVDETLLPMKVNLSTSFREMPFSVGMSPL